MLSNLSVHSLHESCNVLGHFDRPALRAGVVLAAVAVARAVLAGLTTLLVGACASNLPGVL